MIECACGIMRYDQVNPNKIVVSFLIFNDRYSLSNVWLWRRKNKVWLLRSGFFSLLLSIKHVLDDKIMNLILLKNSTFGLPRSNKIERQ